MFGCSQLFIGIVAPLTKAEVKESFKKQADERAKWGPRKRIFRDGRRKRKEAWKEGEE